MTHVQKDTAVLLKEKGFDNTHPFANKDINGISFDIPNNIYPTIYEATEWLRAKGVHVCVQPDGYGSGNELVWYCIVWVTYEHLNPQPNIVRENPTVSDKYKSFPTHDQALEAGIVHALKYLP